MEYKRFDNTIIARIDKGEEILEQLKVIAINENIKLASINALGAIDDFTVGVYKIDEKKYYSNSFKGYYEITSLTGTISTMDGEYYAHLHMSWKEAGKVWGVSYLGNFVGCAILALLFVGAGASGTADYFAGFIGNKLSIPLGQMFFRAVLCNFFVCLGVLCGMKLKSDAGRFLMIVMCISGFVVSGFEHCIANMGIFVTAYCLVPGLSLGAMVKSMVVVTLGNMVGGALLLAWPLRKMSADK